MGKKGGIDATRLALGGYDREMERYGIKGPTGGGRALEMQGLSGGDYRDAKDVEKDLINAARNDYDTRRTLEAAAMSGKKKAQDILDSGFRNIGDVTNASNFFEKAAKRHGQGGEFSNVSDFMGLTQSMVERDRRKLNESIDERIAAGQEKETPLDRARATFQPGDTNIYSPDAAKAFGYVDAFESRARGEGDYTMTDVRFGNRNTQEAAAQELADAYKAGVKSRLSPDFKMDRIFT